MTLAISQAQINGASQGNSQLREALTAISLKLSQHDTAIGTGPLKKVDANTPTASAAPAPSTLVVTGANGSFTGIFTLPQQANGAPQNSGKGVIYQEVSVSQAANFSTVLQTYPLNSSGSFAIPAPGSTWYFRWRSTTDQKTFNNYQVLGPISAGLQTSAATNPNVVFNRSNFATIDSIGAGSMATIRIFGTGGPGTSWTSVSGNNSEVIPGGTILNVAYGSTQFVAFDGQQYHTVPSLTQTFSDGWVPVGRVSVIANGSGLVLPVIHPVISSGAIIAYNVVSGGNDITGPLSFVIADTGGGTGATVGAQTVSAGALQSLAPGNPGSGYSGATTVTPSGGISAGVGGGGGNAGQNSGRAYSSGINN